MGKRFFFHLIIFFLVSFCYADEITEIEEKTFPLKLGSLISITADEGEIFISSWDKDEVYLKMTKRAWARNRREAECFLKNITVKIYETYDKLTIKEVKRDRGGFRFSDLFDRDFWEGGGYGTCVDFELKVPEDIDLKIGCDEGDVEIRDVRGNLQVEVDEGDVNVSKIISDDIQIYVDEGDIYLSEIDNTEKGFLNIETDEGEIIVQGGSLGEVDIDSDEGDITINVKRLFRSWISTDEGDIEMSFQPVGNADYRFETDEGDIKITIPENSNINVRLQSSEGRIDTDFDLNVYDRSDGEVVDGVIGKGEKSNYLKAYTDEGYIILLKKR
ncbi:MAG: DUF4097 family beta strand repeat-containing protein [bacterium]